MDNQEIVLSEYYRKFGEENSDSARKYYDEFGKDVNMAHKYYEVFGPSNAKIAKEYYSKFGKRYFKSACEYFAQFGDKVNEAREYFGVFGSSNGEIAKKYYDFFGTKEQDLAKQRSLVADYYQLFGNDIAKATENYGRGIKKARLGLMPAKTKEAKKNYWSLFKDNFERAESFYKIFGDQIPSALDDWIRGTPCTAEMAQTILSHKAVPNALQDVPFVVSLLIKLSKDSEAKFWKQYGRGGENC